MHTNPCMQCANPSICVMGGEGHAQPLACYRDYYTAMEEVKEDLQDSRYVERERETSKVAADPRWTPRYVLGSFQPSAWG